MDEEESGQIRCPLCDSSPLLATYGVDEQGRLFIHVKVFKAREVKADVFFRGGEVTLKCYRCLRYHVIRINQRRPILERARRPVLADESTQLSSLPLGMDDL